jgi:hypothetical protein
MKNQRISQRVSNLVRFLRGVIARVSTLTLPRALAPVPVPVRHRCTFGTARRTPPRHLSGWLPLLVGFVLLATAPAWAGAVALPAGVPNIYDPAVQAHFQPVAVTSLEANPDLPAVLLVNTAGEQPPAIFLGVDARNGKDTWSLGTDPIILIVVFADTTTVQGVYMDIGFADRGQPSGTVDPENASALLELLKAVLGTGQGSQI